MCNLARVSTRALAGGSEEYILEASRSIKGTSTLHQFAPLFTWAWSTEKHIISIYTLVDHHKIMIRPIMICKPIRGCTYCLRFLRPFYNFSGGLQMTHLYVYRLKPWFFDNKSYKVWSRPVLNRNNSSKLLTSFAHNAWYFSLSAGQTCKNSIVLVCMSLYMYINISHWTICYDRPDRSWEPIEE